MNMSQLKYKSLLPGSRMLGGRQDGVMVPGSSGRHPAMGHATALDDIETPRDSSEFRGSEPPIGLSSEGVEPGGPSRSRSPSVRAAVLRVSEGMEDFLGDREDSAPLERRTKRTRNRVSSESSDSGSNRNRKDEERMPIERKTEASLENILSISSEEEPESPKKKKITKRRKKESSPNLVTELNLSIGSLKDDANMENKTVDDIVGMIGVWLADTNDVRLKSKNLKGNMMRRLKDNTDNVSIAVKALQERLASKGDVDFIQKQNAELLCKLKESENEKAKINRRLNVAEARITELNDQLQEFNARLGSKSGSRDVLSPTGKGERPNRQASGRNTREEEISRDYTRFLSNAEKKVESLIAELKETSSRIQRAKTPVIEEDPAPVRENRRKLPKIIENIQVVPPRHPHYSAPTYMTDDTEDGVSSGDAFTPVLSRRERRGKRVAFARDSSPSGSESVSRMASGGPRPVVEGRSNYNSDRVPRRRVPRSAAVAIRAANDGISYAEVLRKAREGISLPSLKIENSKIRKAVNGGIIIEIPGPEGGARADELAGNLRKVIGDVAVISRPSMKGELRIVNFDESISRDEVGNLICSMGDCRVEDVKLGPIRPLNNGLFSIWVQCPLTAANKIASSRKIRIGWSMARVDLLRARPIQCFRCWHFGHARFNCRAGVDRAGCCFNCGGRDHVIKDCKNKPTCQVCMDLKLDPGHRLGTLNCGGVNFSRNRKITRNV